MEYIITGYSHNVHRKEEIYEGIAYLKSNGYSTEGVFDNEEKAREVFNKLSSECIKLQGRGWEFHEYVLEKYDEDKEESTMLDCTKFLWCEKNEDGDIIGIFKHLSDVKAYNLKLMELGESAYYDVYLPDGTVDIDN